MKAHPAKLNERLKAMAKHLLKRLVILCCTIMILLYIGNLLYWGKPIESSSYISPDGKYKITIYRPENSFYGWMTTDRYYFIKTYVFENNSFRYACTSPILDEAGMGPIHWPSDRLDNLSNNLGYFIPAKPLREGFISFAPTLERICPE